ncbi:MAG: hypothetical protein ABI382_11015 [Nakamurella sp.]
MANMHAVKVGRRYGVRKRGDGLRVLAGRRVLTLWTASKRADISEAVLLAELLHP